MKTSRSLRNLQRTLYLLAAIPVVAGAWTVLVGSDSVPHAGQPTASLESELRFYAVWWIGAGVFLGWLAPRVQDRTRELRVFCALLFLGGLSRIVGIIDVGWPRPQPARADGAGVQRSGDPGRLAGQSGRSLEPSLG